MRGPASTIALQTPVNQAGRQRWEREHNNIDGIHGERICEEVEEEFSAPSSISALVGRDFAFNADGK
jgi:hypothetical protein